MELTVSESFIISLCEKLVMKKLILHHKGTLCSAGVTVDSTGTTPSSFSLQQICYKPSFGGKGSLGNWRYYFNGQQNLHHSLSFDVDLPVDVTPPLDAEPTRKVSLPSGLFSPLLPKTDQICRCFVALFRSVSFYKSSSQCC